MPPTLQATFAWLDLETTGLRHDADVPLAAGLILTTGKLEIVAETELYCWWPDSVLNDMHPTPREMHERSGLLRKVRESRLDHVDVDKLLGNMLGESAVPGTVYMAGSSCHFDRIFCKRWFPHFERQLHYRQLDVSAIKILCQQWFPDHCFVPSKEKAHTPLADLHNSIAELQHYREIFF